MLSNPESTVERIERLTGPVLEDMGYDLVDLEFLSDGGRWILRFYIDGIGGVTLDDCVRVSREIGALLDEEDIVSHEYVLEVSSPGLDRPLKKEKDFLDSLGKKVKIKMSVPVEGRKNFTGRLSDFQDGILTIVTDGESRIRLAMTDIQKTRLVYEED